MSNIKHTQTFNTEYVRINGHTAIETYRNGQLAHVGLCDSDCKCIASLTFTHSVKRGVLYTFDKTGNIKCKFSKVRGHSLYELYAEPQLCSEWLVRFLTETQMRLAELTEELTDKLIAA